MNRYYGTVTDWNERGFGFIEADNLDEAVFCHSSALKFFGPKRLRTGQRVSFTITQCDRGREATDVHFY